MTLKPFSERDHPRSRAMPRRAMLWSRLPVKCTRCVPHDAGGQTMRSTCGPSRRTMLDLSVPAESTFSTSGSPSSRAITAAGIVDRGEEVEVADRRSTAAQRAGGRDAPDAAHVTQRVDEGRHERIGVVEEEARVRAAPLDAADPVQDVLLGASREALDRAQLAGLGGGAKPLERVDAELGVQQSHRLRADARARAACRAARRGPGRAAARGTRAGRSRSARRASRPAPARRRGSSAARRGCRGRRRHRGSARRCRPRDGRPPPCRRPRRGSRACRRSR